VKTDLIDRSYAALAASDKRPRPRRWPGRLIGALVIAVIAAVSLYVYAPQYLPAPLVQLVSTQTSVAPGGRGGRGGRRAAASGEDVVPVLAAEAEETDVPVYFDGVGSSRALNTVTVRAQVDGKLMSMNFKEGQDVDQDFVLAEIDATIYQAQYDQAVAKKAQDEALLANAHLDLDRYFRLSQSNSGTKQQYDTQKALVAQLEAQVQGDQGAIDNAKAILSYAKIIAPLAGRTGIRQVDAGNIVHAADTTGIVVITQLRPIAVIFTLPQQQLARVNKAFAKGPLSVEALGDDNRTVVDRGTLEVIDNQVDQTTGTVKLKAEFPNADLQLWPGQFVNVKLLVDTIERATVIPSAAVQRGPNGTFVYVANDDNTVTVRPVTVAQQDESRAVIASGVDAGDRVVTTGFGQLTNGAVVAVGEQENLDRPAGSERRRRLPRGGGAQANRTLPGPAAPTGPAASAPAAGKAAAAPTAVTGTEATQPAAQPAASQPDIGRPDDAQGDAAAVPAAAVGTRPAAGTRRRDGQRRTQSGAAATATQSGEAGTATQPGGAATATQSGGVAPAIQ
jgi:multidrug efflux system membrane fusion protein